MLPCFFVYLPSLCWDQHIGKISNCPSFYGLALYKDQLSPYSLMRNSEDVSVPFCRCIFFPGFMSLWRFSHDLLLPLALVCGTVVSLKLLLVISLSGGPQPCNVYQALSVPTCLAAPPPKIWTLGVCLGHSFSSPPRSQELGVFSWSGHTALGKGPLQTIAPDCPAGVRAAGSAEQCLYLLQGDLVCLFESVSWGRGLPVCLFASVTIFMLYLENYAFQ